MEKLIDAKGITRNTTGAFPLQNVFSPWFLNSITVSFHASLTVNLFCLVTKIIMIRSIGDIVVFPQMPAIPPEKKLR